jgi:hypothetical protein
MKASRLKRIDMLNKSIKYIQNKMTIVNIKENIDENIEKKNKNKREINQERINQRKAPKQKQTKLTKRLAAAQNKYDKEQQISVNARKNDHTVTQKNKNNKKYCKKYKNKYRSNQISHLNLL